MQTTGLGQKFAGMRGKVTAGVMALAVTFGAAAATVPQAAHAQNLQSQPQTVAAEQVQPAGLQGGYWESGRYARSGKGIGVTVFWGSGIVADFSQDELRANIVNGFWDHLDVSSEVNYEPLEGHTDGTIRFHIGDNVTEPLLLSTFLENPFKHMQAAKAAYTLSQDLSLNDGGASADGVSTVSLDN